jgi:hypothetical protein
MFPSDDLLTAAYERLNAESIRPATADRIAGNADLRSAFTGYLSEEYRSANQEQVAARLVTLRKLGRLPRLHRGRRASA